MRISKEVVNNELRITALQIALRFSLSFYVLKLIFEFFRYSIWIKVEKGVLISNRQLGVVETIEHSSLYTQLVLFIICGVLLAVWMRRSYENLSRFQSIKASPRVAVISWFIPLFSFLGPYLIYTEIVNGWEEILAENNYIRRDTRRKTIKNWWWLTWLVAQVLFVFSFGYERTELIYGALASLLFLLSNVLLLSSLNDLKNLEQGVGRLQNVHEKTLNFSTSDDII